MTFTHISQQKIITVALTIVCTVGIANTMINKPKDIGLMSAFTTLLIVI
jgi:hypothetical protein